MDIISSHRNGLLLINTNSLSKELCKELIKSFETEKNKYGYDGITAGGLDKEIKNTTDMVISKIPSWDKINKLLRDEIQYNLNEYMRTAGKRVMYQESGEYKDEDEKYWYMLSSPKLSIPAIQMQKYNKNEGKYVYHNDFSCNFDDRDMRQITFLWYINDVEEGGETQFGNDILVKPTAGKLVLFPAHWTFPHRANMPISNDKYIITGWLYEQYDKNYPGFIK